MRLEGSCHCGAVRFSVESATPYPHQACYCSICRKTAGGGGYAINLGANYRTMEVEGEENTTRYHAKMYDRDDMDTSPAERRFCSLCVFAVRVRCAAARCGSTARTIRSWSPPSPRL